MFGIELIETVFGDKPGHFFEPRRLIGLVQFAQGLKIESTHSTHHHRLQFNKRPDPTLNFRFECRRLQVGDSLEQPKRLSLNTDPL
jgi:hypothetical protein